MLISNLDKWSQYLTDATRDMNSHQWICEVQTKKGKRKIKVISQIEYDNFLKHESSWNGCRKLSFREIVSISKNLMSYLVIGSNELSKKPNNLWRETQMHMDSLFDPVNVLWPNENRVFQNLLDIQIKEFQLKPMTTALQKMLDRSISKRTVEKTTGIWGIIKWYIWSWFFDTRKQIQDIREDVPNLKKFIDEACQTAKWDIYHNLTLFEKGLDIPENERHFSPDHNGLWSPQDIRIHIELLKIKNREKLANNEGVNHLVVDMEGLIKIWQALIKYPIGS